MNTSTQKLRNYNIGIEEIDGLSANMMQDFLSDTNNEHHIIMDEYNRPKSFTICAKDESIYFGKGIMVKWKFSKKTRKIGKKDIAIEYKKVVMKRPAYCIVLGKKILENGIRHGEEDEKYDRGFPRFEVTDTLDALLVIQGMNKTPFLAPLSTPS